MGTAEWIAVIAALAAVIGAVVSIVQAVAARRASAESARSASVVSEALLRTAGAQERTADAARPNAWSQLHPRPTGEWWMRNSSRRAIRVERYEVDPPEAAALVVAEESLPFDSTAGDVLVFQVDERNAIAARSITLVWRFVDEDQPHRSRRFLEG